MAFFTASGPLKLMQEAYNAYTVERAKHAERITNAVAKASVKASNELAAKSAASDSTSEQSLDSLGAILSRTAYDENCYRRRTRMKYGKNKGKKVPNQQLDFLVGKTGNKKQVECKRELLRCDHKKTNKAKNTCNCLAQVYGKQKCTRSIGFALKTCCQTGVTTATWATPANHSLQDGEKMMAWMRPKILAGIAKVTLKACPNKSPTDRTTWIVPTTKSNGRANTDRKTNGEIKKHGRARCPLLDYGRLKLPRLSCAAGWDKRDSKFKFVCPRCKDARYLGLPASLKHAEGKRVDHSEFKIFVGGTNRSPCNMGTYDLLIKLTVKKRGLRSPQLMMGNAALIPTVDARVLLAQTKERLARKTKPRRGLACSDGRLKCTLKICCKGCKGKDCSIGCCSAKRLLKREATRLSREVQLQNQGIPAINGYVEKVVRDAFAAFRFELAQNITNTNW